METQGLNLFIVDDNKSMVTALKRYLINKFGGNVNITTFYDGESCLEKINKQTHVVILDYFLNGKNGLEILKSIKKLNPQTEVIMLSSNVDLGLAKETFKVGAKDYVIKGPNAWKKVTKLVKWIITEPIRAMVREYGISKFMIIFFSTFTAMGAVVYWVLQMM